MDTDFKQISIKIPNSLYDYLEELSREPFGTTIDYRIMTILARYIVKDLPNI